MNTNGGSNKRKVGGFGLSSSIVRSNIDDEGYVKYITRVINLRLFGDKEMLTYRIGTAGFEIIFDKVNSILIRDLDFVKRCRSASVIEFEKVIINILQRAGYDFDKQNEYYHTVIK